MDYFVGNPKKNFLPHLPKAGKLCYVNVIAKLIQFKSISYNISIRRPAKNLSPVKETGILCISQG